MEKNLFGALAGAGLILNAFAGELPVVQDVDVARFNAQHGNSLTVRTSDKFHDRFLIIDNAVLIHVGASLNHLGKKCFAFSSLDKSNIPDILAKI